MSAYSKVKVLFNHLYGLFKYIELNTPGACCLLGLKMAATKRKIGVYSVAGIVLAIVIIASILLSGLNPIGNNSSGPNSGVTGTLSVSVKDAPVELAELYLTVTGIYVQGNEENSWIELPLIDDQTEIKFDLLMLKDISLELSNSQLSAGDYNKIRIEVSSATATYPNGLEPQTQTLKVPSGHIDVLAKFTILEDQETKLIIDIQPDSMAISSSGNFRPIIKTSIFSAGATPTPQITTDTT